MRILGIDPGSQVTGYGIVDEQDGRLRYVASGCLRVQGEDLAQRLGMIFRELSEVVRQYRPQEMAVERVFMHRNADSALKLGQARGAALCAGDCAQLVITEYTPREIKQALVGTGAAAKPQVQHMVKVLLGLDAVPQADAADALAVALCHGHTRRTRARIAAAAGDRPS